MEFEVQIEFWWVPTDAMLQNEGIGRRDAYEGAVDDPSIFEGHLERFIHKLIESAHVIIYLLKSNLHRGQVDCFENQKSIHFWWKLESYFF